MADGREASTYEELRDMVAEVIRKTVPQQRRDPELSLGQAVDEIMRIMRDNPDGGRVRIRV